MAFLPSPRRSIASQIDAEPAAVYGVRLIDPAMYDGPICQAVRVLDGAVRDIWADRRTGQLDALSVQSFANGGKVETSAWYELRGKNTPMTLPVNARPLIANNGVCNTVGGMPIYVAQGNTRGSAPVASSWANPLVINTVLAATSMPTTNAWVAGVDLSISGYRDCEIYVPANSFGLALGEDYTGMYPQTSAMAKDTVSIVTAIRTSQNPSVRGYMIQNDQITSTYTSGSQATDINADKIWVFGDPDTGSFCPAGWGIQELWIWNGQTPPSGDTLSLLHADQSDVFGIPIRQGPTYPISVSRNILNNFGQAITTNTGLKITYK